MSEGRSTQGGARFQRDLPRAGMFCAFSAENQRGDRKTPTHRPSYTKQPTLKKICANLQHLRIKNVCYQSLIAYLLLALTLPALLLCGCGKRTAPPYDRMRSQLLLSACDNIGNGQTDDAISDLQRLLDIDPHNVFAEAALHHEQQRRLLTEANALIARADHLALRLWLDQVIREGQACPELLAVRDVVPALAALDDFLAHGPWQNAAERQQALMTFDPHLPVLQQSTAFQAFYHTEKEQLAAMRFQEQRQTARRLLHDIDLALFSGLQQRQAALLDEFAAAVPGHPLQRYITHLHAKTGTASLQALLSAADKDIPAEETALAVVLAATLQWHELSRPVRLAILEHCRQMPTVPSLCGAWLKARADHHPQHYQELFSYLRNQPNPPPPSRELLQDYLNFVLLPKQSVTAWCWRSPAPGVTDFLARLKQVGETQPVASNKERP